MLNADVVSARASFAFLKTAKITETNLNDCFYLNTVETSTFDEKHRRYSDFRNAVESSTSDRPLETEGLICLKLITGCELSAALPC